MGIRDNTCDICGKYLNNRIDQPRMIEGKYMCKPCFDKMMEDERSQVKEEPVEKEITMNDILMSTTAVIDGYKIVENCGIVFGETVFKHSFVSSLGASLSNMFDLLSFQSTEMSGSMNLIETARDYAYKKMIAQATSRGANAVVGIESDNTIGGEIMYISLYGTAVKVEKIDDSKDE